MAKKMSLHQIELLRWLAQTPVADITDECVVKALARRGYAERFSEKMAHMNSRHQWRITEAGRLAIKDA